MQSQNLTQKQVQEQVITRPSEIDTQDAIRPEQGSVVRSPGYYFWVCYKDPYESYWYGPYINSSEAQENWYRIGFSSRWKSGVQPNYYLEVPNFNLSCP